LLSAIEVLDDANHGVERLPHAAIQTRFKKTVSSETNFRGKWWMTLLDEAVCGLPEIPGGHRGTKQALEASPALLGIRIAALDEITNQVFPEIVLRHAQLKDKVFADERLHIRRCSDRGLPAAGRDEKKQAENDRCGFHIRVAALNCEMRRGWRAYQRLPAGRHKSYLRRPFRSDSSRPPY